MTQRDGIGLAAVTIGVAALLAFRQVYVEPQAWGAVCAAASRPFVCAPRGALLWMQHFHVWGGGALVLGIAAFLGATFWCAVAAVTFGIAAVINYNATWGTLGAALGAWAWLRRHSDDRQAARGTDPTA